VVQRIGLAIYDYLDGLAVREEMRW
jgi:hypothetical protein